jgi:hypothetical protein
MKISTNKIKKAMMYLLIPITFFLDLLKQKKLTAKLRFGTKNKLLSYMVSSNTFSNHKIYLGVYENEYVTSILEFSSTIIRLAVDDFVRFEQLSAQRKIIPADCPHIIVKKSRGLTKIAEENGFNAKEWEITKIMGEKLKKKPFNSDDHKHLYQFLMKLTSKPISHNLSENLPIKIEKNTKENIPSFNEIPEEFKEPIAHTQQIIENIDIQVDFDSDLDTDMDTESSLDNPILPQTTRNMFFEDYDQSKH